MGLYTVIEETLVADLAVATNETVRIAVTEGTLVTVVTDGMG